MLMEKTLKNEWKSTIEKKFGTVEYKRNAIYWCDLGNGDASEQAGVRPVIIVQNNIGNRYSPTVIVAPLTTRDKAKLPTHVLLDANDYNFLKSNSIVLLEQIRVLDKRRLGDYIGELNNIDINKINAALNVSLSLVNIEKTNNTNNINNVTDITIIRRVTEKAKEIEELDTTLKVLVARNIDINMMKPILLERQDKIREFYIICKNNNLNPEKYYIDYNKQKLDNNKVKTI